MSLARLLVVFLGATLLPVLIVPAAAEGTHTPTVIQSVRHDVSAPMRDIISHMAPAQPMGTEEEPFEIPNHFLKPRGHTLSSDQQLLRLLGIQSVPSGVPAPSADLAFDGIDKVDSGCGCLPPDTEGDVGDNEYIQWVNTSWSVYSKTDGSLIAGPTPGNSFWSGFGGKCETTNSGDPLAVFDQHAHRWVMSQFVTSSPFAQCVAVSTTSDPLGTYERYEFDWPNRFGDYGKLGVWVDETGTQDAYLLTTHEFNGAGSQFFGAAYIAMDRDAMLAGAATANMVRFPGYDSYGVEPINLIGSVSAPANACPTFVHFDETSSDYLFWDMCLDWTTPPYGTVFGSDPQRVHGNTFSSYNNEVPQQDSSAGLDPFGTHIMYHAQARAFPDGAPERLSMVVTHTVQGDVHQAAVDWIHFRLDNGGTPPVQPEGLTKTISDQGVYAPDDTNRWMGSVALDTSDNMGIGYSLSGDHSHPQVMINGRGPGDAPGTLRDEQSCTEGVGNGSQTSSSDRWGDYSAMNVDPVDQCTFWYTNEYYPTTGASSWHTRICSFKFDGCGNPDYEIVSDTPRRVEMCGATAAADPAWTLRAGVLNGFTGSVALTGNGLPAGTSAAFTPNPLTAPGQSQLTLTGGLTLPSGEYTFDVDGTSGAITRSIALELGVSADAPVAPVLAAPAAGAVDVKVRPRLAWGDTSRIFGDGFDGVPLPPPSASDAINYTVDVATDPGFASIVASATVATNFWYVDVTLDPSTVYYWRVTPHNYCGDGAVSAVASFTTGVPGVCPAGTTSTTVFEDDFQSGTNGWTTAGEGATGWTQGTAASGTGLSTTVWQAPDNDTASDQTLVSPSIAIPAGAAAVILSYDSFHNFETGGADSCYDNGSLALAADGAGAFSYLGPERMFTDPYTGIALSTTALSGNMVWCHPGPAAPTHAIVDLDDFSGHAVQVEFRALSDANTTANAPNGMAIDNFKVEICQ
jgi:hypothetical protein